jgi:glutamate-5-semialdehyde dehydrogenase
VNAETRIETAADATGLMADMGARARSAARVLAATPTASEGHRDPCRCRRIRANRASILAANAQDMAAATHLSPAMQDRLKLDDGRIEGMAAGLDAVAGLADPVGEFIRRGSSPTGCSFRRVRVPLGVVGIIYESRPNVTADAGALCLMLGQCLHPARRKRSAGDIEGNPRSACWMGCERAGLPEDAIQLVPTADRAFVGAMLGASGLIDMI